MITVKHTWTLNTCRWLSPVPNIIILEIPEIDFSVAFGTHFLILDIYAYCLSQRNHSGHAVYVFCLIFILVNFILAIYMSDFWFNRHDGKPRTDCSSPCSSRQPIHDAIQNYSASHFSSDIHDVRTYLWIDRDSSGWKKQIKFEVVAAVVDKNSLNVVSICRK